MCSRTPWRRSWLRWRRSVTELARPPGRAGGGARDVRAPSRRPSRRRAARRAGPPPPRRRGGNGDRMARGPGRPGPTGQLRGWSSSPIGPVTHLRAQHPSGGQVGEVLVLGGWCESAGSDVACGVQEPHEGSSLPRERAGLESRHCALRHLGALRSLGGSDLPLRGPRRPISHAAAHLCASPQCSPSTARRARLAAATRRLKSAVTLRLPLTRARRPPWRRRMR